MAGGVSRDGFVALITLFTVLAIAVVGLRFWALKITRRNVDWSDYLVVVGLTFAIGVTITGYLIVYTAGAGYHMVQLNENEMERVLQLFTAASPLWGASTVAIKLSILAFYLKTFRGNLMRCAIYITGVITLIALVIIVVEPFTQCTPFKYTYDKIHTTGHCRNNQPFLVAVASINLGIDVTIFCLPLPTLWGLQMNVQKKISISVIFLLGLVVCVMSAMRIQALYNLVQTDFTWTLLDDCLWAVLEITLGAINACLPFMRPLVKKIPVPFLTDFSQGSRKSYNFPNSGKHMSGSHDKMAFPIHRMSPPNSYHAHIGTETRDSFDKGSFDKLNSAEGPITVNHSVDIAREPRESNFV